MQIEKIGSYEIHRMTATETLQYVLYRLDQIHTSLSTASRMPDLNSPASRCQIIYPVYQISELIKIAGSHCRIVRAHSIDPPAAVSAPPSAPAGPKIPKYPVSPDDPF